MTNEMKDDAGAVAEPFGWIVGNVARKCASTVFFSEDDAIRHFERTKSILHDWVRVEPLYATPTAAGIAAPPASEIAELSKLVHDNRVSDEAIGMRIRNTWPLWKAAPPALSADAVSKALADLGALFKYARWTISTESPTHHPTMPSAVAQAEAALAVIATTLTAPVAGADATINNKETK